MGECKHGEKSLVGTCGDCLSDVLVERTRLRAVAEVADMLETAWGIIANAGGGNWETQTEEWRGAAVRWRDNYHAWLSGEQKNAAPSGAAARGRSRDDDEDVA